MQLVNGVHAIMIQKERTEEPEEKARRRESERGSEKVKARAGQVPTPYACLSDASLQS